MAICRMLLVIAILGCVGHGLLMLSSFFLLVLLTGHGGTWFIGRASCRSGNGNLLSRDDGAAIVERIFGNGFVN